LTKIAEKTMVTLEQRNIPIPRLMLTPRFAEIILHDFDLDTDVLRNYTNERRSWKNSCRTTGRQIFSVTMFPEGSKRKSRG